MLPSLGSSSLKLVFCGGVLKKKIKKSNNHEYLQVGEPYWAADSARDWNLGTGAKGGMDCE